MDRLAVARRIRRERVRLDHADSVALEQIDELSVQMPGRQNTIAARPRNGGSPAAGTGNGDLAVAREIGEVAAAGKDVVPAETAADPAASVPAGK